MTELTISKLVTLADTEAAISAVCSSSTSFLQINKDLLNKRRGALHDAARLQMIVTWARRWRNCELHFHEANTIDAVLAALCEYAPGIVCLRLCDGVVVGDNRVSRRESLVPAAQKMRFTDDENWAELIRGRTIDMTCVSGSTVEYLRPLFSARDRRAVKQKDEMYELFQSLSREIAKRDAVLIPEHLLISLGIFSSELFRNTQQHATRDRYGVPYQAHAEGLIVSWTTLDDVTYASDFSEHERLLEFWQTELVEANAGKSKVLRCLQISFFDTGPGFAGRLTGLETEKLTRDKERIHLLDCLKKYASGDQIAGSGLGLRSVLESLSAIGGLIRIRSGRHSVFNVFREGGAGDLFDFSDWTKTKLGDACGAVVTILIPLRRS